MIPDWEKNEVFVSSLLREWNNFEYNNIQKFLTKHSIELRTIEQTKDIWARDYMPIQISKEEYIQFRYEPNYLKKYPKYRTIPSKIKLLENYSVAKSTLNLDGGNVVCSSDKVILTNRVYEENKLISPKEIHKELEVLFEAEVYFVPAIKEDLTGHIDGHLRFIDNDTIIVNELKNEAEYWVDGFEEMNNKSGLNVVEMPWYIDKKDSKGISAIGSYLNYLQIKDLILFPVFEEDQELDHKCLDIIKKSQPNATIKPININRIGKEGGLMNCITWTNCS